MPSQGPFSSPSPSARPTTSERFESEDPSSSHCNCGKGDGSGNYVLCDNDDCKVGWYHWECVHVIKKPLGTWLCPSCSPSAAFYIKQLVQEREAPPLVPEVEKVDDQTGPEGRKQEQEQVLRTRKREVAKKGVAVKRPAAPESKSRWVGWVELSPEGEEDYKKKVDAQWSVDNVISGKRRRASKAVGKDNETGSRTLRPHSRVGGSKRIVDQQQEQEAEEEEQQQDGPVHRKASVVDLSYEDSDVEYQDTSLEASSSHASDVSEYVDANEYMDGDEASEASRTHANSSNGRVMADSQSPPPESAPATNPASQSGISPVLQVSEPAIRLEDTVDVDAVSPAVESNNCAPLYQRQGNCWGEFPESAIRSTLPRLG